MTNKNDQQDALFKISNLCKTFDTRHGLKRGKIDVLRNVSFNLYKGRALALVGESGSGKSTVARILTKLYKPTQGNIFYKEQDISTIKNSADTQKYRRDVQMVFQDPFGSLNPTHNIYHHIARPLLCHGYISNKAELTNTIFDILKQVELKPELTAYKYPHELSGGQRQRVALARALAVGAKVILADEPTSMLDVSVRIDVLNLLKRLKDDEGISFLYITHDIATARFFAEDIAVLYQGQIVEWGSAKNVIENPQHCYTKLLLSAVPNARLKFENMDNEHAFYLNNANKIREISAETSNKTTQINDNHYMRLHRAI